MEEWGHTLDALRIFSPGSHSFRRIDRLASAKSLAVMRGRERERKRSAAACACVTHTRMTGALVDIGSLFFFPKKMCKKKKLKKRKMRAMATRGVAITECAIKAV